MDPPLRGSLGVSRESRTPSVEAMHARMVVITFGGGGEDHKAAAVV